MRVKGTVRLRATPDDVLPATVEVEPGWVRLTTGTAVIGEWRGNDVSLSTEGDLLVLRAEGEELLVDVPDRYRVLDAFTGPSSTPADLRDRVAQAVERPKNRRRGFVVAAATAAVVLGVGGVTVALLNGTSTPETPSTVRAIAPVPTTRLTTTTIRRTTTTRQVTTTTLSAAESDRQLAISWAKWWVDTTLPRLDEIVRLYNSRDDAEASVECALADMEAAAYVIVYRSYRWTELSQLVLGQAEEVEKFYRQCALGLWSIAPDTHDRINAYHKRIVDLCDNDPSLRC